MFWKCPRKLRWLLHAVLPDSYKHKCIFSLDAVWFLQSASHAAQNNLFSTDPLASVNESHDRMVISQIKCDLLLIAFSAQF